MSRESPGRYRISLFLLVLLLVLRPQTRPESTSSFLVLQPQTVLGLPGFVTAGARDHNKPGLSWCAHLSYWFCLWGESWLIPQVHRVFRLRQSAHSVPCYQQSLRSPQVTLTLQRGVVSAQSIFPFSFSLKATCEAFQRPHPAVCVLCGPWQGPVASWEQLRSALLRPGPGLSRRGSNGGANAAFSGALCSRP